MKVLITGGCGFIGSHTADRFHKEGYGIYILDNLSSGSRENVTVDHRFFQMNIEDKKCEEVFANNDFDAVVHLAAHNDAARSLEDPSGDAQANVMGLVNMLNLSAKYKVKKFVFASSAAVYGNFEKSTPFLEGDGTNPAVPYGVSKLTGEQYCRLWRQTYGLNTICLRFSNVYGPRQSLKGEGGVVAVFMSNLFSGETLLIHGSGEQTRDFIYVGDVVDAIFRSVDVVSADTLNISANADFSIKDLVDQIRRLHHSVNVEYTLPRKGDVRHSRLSNQKAMTELQWSPKFTFEKGIEQTYDWYKQYYQNKKTQKKKSNPLPTGKKDRPKILRRILPYLENLLSFLLVMLLSGYSQKHGLETPIDLQLVYIIIISIMYGLKQSTIAIFLACSFFVWQIHGVGHDLLSLVYNVNTLIQFCLYIFIGSVLGYSVDSNKNQIEAAKEERDDIKGKFEFLYEMYMESKIVRKELQDQITNTEDSFGKIVQITNSLDTLEPEKVFGQTVGIIERMMKSQDVYIYSVSRNQDFLRLNSKSLNTEINADKSIRVSDVPEIQKLMEKKEMFVNKALDATLPMMMSPIVVANKVVAVIAIYNMEFEAMSLYKQNLLKVVSSLITSSLARAYQYEQAIFDEKYFPGTSVFRNQYFTQLIDSKREAKKKNNTDFTLLKVLDSKGWESKGLAHDIETSIREVDFMGVNEKNEFFILLSNTKTEEATFVVNRLLKKNIRVEVMGGERIYGSDFWGTRSA